MTLEKKSLLIIKSQPTSLGAVEGFLRNREWKIKSTTNLKEALMFLLKEQPQFVMVSVDHPNRKVRNLPRILIQAFPVCVITYAEESSSASLGLLNSYASEYVLYPPVTGPAVERTVNKYYKDLQTRGTTQGNSRAAINAAQNGVIAIKGEANSFSSMNAQNILSRLLNEDLGIVPQGLGAGTLHTYAGTGQNSSGWVPLPEELNSARRPRFTPEEIESDPRSTKMDSVILRGTKEALDKSCAPTPFESADAIEQSTSVACITVQSSRFSGYLVTAMGKNKSLDNEFMEKVRHRLFRFLKENGEDIQESDPSLELNIKPVPFEDWSLQYAEFLRKSIHNGNEVAMAFFPREDIVASYDPSHAEEMAAINIEELAGDVAVEFNVYIHLPRNNRYVLYTPRGSVFYHVQKERLHTQGISALHIFKGDLPDLHKYRAQNFLNKKILEYETSKDGV